MLSSRSITAIVPVLALVAAALTGGTGRAASAATGEDNLGAIQPAGGDGGAEALPPPPIDPRSQLLITDLAVVEDPVRTNPLNGTRATWSFRYLMENLAGRNDPAQMVRLWLEQWERDQVVNGRVARARPSIRQAILDPWLRASGGRRLDLNKAPFKLLAIVNRIDLRETDGTRVTTAGEGRFVFGVLGADGRPLPPIGGPATGGFLIIFEYEMPATDMSQLRSWATAWGDLGRLRLGSPEYNLALERITRRFSDRGMAPAKPNGSALNQLRSNEIALAAPWELREFTIDPGTGLLLQHTVAQTPDTVELNGTAALADLVNGHEGELLDGSFDLDDARYGAASLSGPFTPRDFPDFFQRSFTRIDLGNGVFDIPWSAAGIRSNDARHAFGLNTCGGCHRTETATPFIMVGFPPDHQLPRSLGRPALLARFLTGEMVPDPVDPATTRSFADLDRRRRDLADLLQSFLLGPGPIEKSHRPKFVH